MADPLRRVIDRKMHVTEFPSGGVQIYIEDILECGHSYKRIVSSRTQNGYEPAGRRRCDNCGKAGQ